ncbi:hypothetical protein [Paraburkholderia sp.]|jgi:hypothetical protein|uniref:hypothetical protein n=1 Tax=Paraburkholderia sp. TaxID=1926495 RepID=UPI002F416118
MKDDSSNFGKTGRVDATGDKYDKGSVLEEGLQTVPQTRETVRNWAWTHSNESYDWMDSHSPFTSQDVFH